MAGPGKSIAREVGKKAVEAIATKMSRADTPEPKGRGRPPKKDLTCIKMMLAKSIKK